MAPLEPADLEKVVNRALAHPQGLGGAFRLEPEAAVALIRLSGGDARKALGALEAAATACSVDPGGLRNVITADHVAQAVDRAMVRYDRDGDQHYDVTSAFIKSVRGSDVDAALYYLARMIEAGEDPRFISRRLIILASEDVGLADPAALGVAVDAAQAVALIGMPEGRIPLSQATIYLALAPKSNASYTAISQAQKAVQNGQIGDVPRHLRDAHYDGAAALGHGAGYLYPHDVEAGIVRQRYAPEGVAGSQWYRPTGRGFEAELVARDAAIRAILFPEAAGDP